MSNDDDQLIEMLGHAYAELDPVPESIRSFGRSSRRLIALESELAELVADTMSSELVATRSAGDVRTVRFEIRQVEIELEVDDDMVTGSVEPRCDEIAVVTMSDRTVLEVSDRGVFRFELPTEQFRLECSIEGASIRTSFVTP